MTCLHNHDQILEFLRKIFLKGFQIYQNYLCALRANAQLYNKKGGGGGGGWRCVNPQRRTPREPANQVTKQSNPLPRDQADLISVLVFKIHVKSVSTV